MSEHMSEKVHRRFSLQEEYLYKYTFWKNIKELSFGCEYFKPPEILGHFLRQ